MNKKHLFYCFYILIILFLTGCSTKSQEAISKTGIYFDTVIQIDIYDSNNTKLLDRCFEHCETFEQTISRTIETSEIYQINHAKGAPVEVSDVTLELLQKGIEYGDLTNGKFDITIAPLMELWDFKNNTGDVPEDKDIQKALSHVNYKNIIIEGTRVTLTDPYAAIDLGGIAKGYMADFLKEYLVSEGVKSALINLGGNILTIGSKPNGTPFNLGIQKPFDEQGTTITSVKTIDTSVVSSGVYERYFEADNKLYHHILDTTTGYPCDNELLGVTILSEDSVDGDVLSTSCFVLGLDDGVKLIKSLDGVEAIFITEDNKLIDTRIN